MTRHERETALTFREAVKGDIAALQSGSKSPLFYIAAVAGLNRFSAVLLYRIASHLRRLRAGRLPAAFFYRWNTVVNGCELHPSAKIGPGLHLPHPNGIVFGPIRAGARLTVQQNVTIGLRDPSLDYSDSDNFPRLGNDVFIGSGAAVLGPVRVGDGARVGANALVLHDVTEGMLAVGNPATTRRREKAKLKIVGSGGGT